MTASKSPDRHSFQKQGYIKRCEEKGEEPNKDYLDMFQQVLDREKNKWDDPKSKENNLEWDLVTTDWILDKARASESYAQNIYAALCNNDFQKLDVLPILKEQTWGCSWRSAGGIVADMRQQGDYIDWYCSGIGGQIADYENGETDDQWRARTGYVPEGKITEEIREDFQKLGWVPAKGGDWEQFS